jgi:hypothetical protein
VVRVSNAADRVSCGEFVLITIFGPPLKIENVMNIKNHPEDRNQWMGPSVVRRAGHLEPRRVRQEDSSMPKIATFPWLRPMAIEFLELNHK